MTWHDTRGAIGSSTRRLAHVDDAKERHDEAVRHPRPRWLMPVMLSVALLLAGGGSVAVVGQLRAADPAKAGTSPHQDRGPERQSQGDEPATARQALPTRYRARVHCLSTGRGFPSGMQVGCSPLDVTGSVTCPSGRCPVWITSSGFVLDPARNDLPGAGIGTAPVTRLELDTARSRLTWTGTVSAAAYHGLCKDSRVSLVGKRRADGSFRLVLTRTEYLPGYEGNATAPTTCEESPGAREELVLEPTD